MRRSNSPRVRVIGPTGDQLGIMTVQEALRSAESSALDLVEVAPGAEPPVCRIMDYGKFVFEQNKKAQSARRKQKQIQVKEVKFRPGTEEGDYQVKLRNLIKFLTHGDKAKVTLRFRGREMVHQELGAELLKRVQTRLGRVWLRGAAAAHGRTANGHGDRPAQALAASPSQRTSACTRRKRRGEPPAQSRQHWNGLNTRRKSCRS